MKSNYILLITGVIIIAVSSCKRDDIFDKNNQQSGESPKIEAGKLVAPGGFKFSTEKKVMVKVSVTGRNYPNEKFVIKIYNAEPNAGALITTGITDAATGAYNTIISIPALQEYVWIEKINENGSRVSEKVKASATVNHLFNAAEAPEFIIRKAGSGLNCSSHCGTSYTNHNGSITVGSGQVVCFSGTINSNITVNSGGAVKICASGTLSGLTVNGTGKVYILEAASLSVANINTNSATAEFYNWSNNLVTTGSVSFNGFTENQGEFKINGDLNVNSSGQFGNYGKITITSNLNADNIFNNYGRITVNGTMNNNGNSEFYNYCYLDVQGNFNNSAYLFNGRLVKCGQTFSQNSSGKTHLDNVGQMSLYNIMVNGDIIGTGTSRAVVKVTHTTTINSNGRFKGLVDLCDSNGIETNNGQIVSPAAISCGGYIPVCPCNIEGFGTPHIADADGDGVPDNQDEFPNDSLRAFNSYIPCFNVCYTLAFEDLWPATGDYDYNDMVIKFSIHKVLNGNNKVVDLEFKVQPIAVGASFDNGFGFRLDEVMASAVRSVQGQSLINGYVTRNSNGTEAGQDRAVIICFDSPEPFIHRTGGGMFNTQHTNATGISDIMTVTATFSTPVDDALLAVDKLNPFIITNKRRGYEVHLPDYKPTSLAATSLFGTMQDRTNPSQGKYYRTANNMPWAFLIQDVFAYPLEKTAVTTAYNYFDDWVISGGSQYPNWYRNFPQYRNNELLY